MQKIEQFVKERQEINQTCESYFLPFSKKKCGILVIRFTLQKNCPSMRFYQDTDDLLYHILIDNALIRID